MNEGEISVDKSGRLAGLVSFRANSNRFESNYKRNKFYRGLYGWKQVIRKNNKQYIYEREGLLDEIPHLKVDKSVYIVPLRKLEVITDYLKGWKGKVKYKVFKVLLEPDRFKKIKEQRNEVEEDWTEVPVK